MPSDVWTVQVDVYMVSLLRAAAYQDLVQYSSRHTVCEWALCDATGYHRRHTIKLGCVAQQYTTSKTQ